MGALTNRETYDVVMSGLNQRGYLDVEREHHEGSRSTLSICDRQVTGISVKCEEYRSVVIHTVCRDGIEILQYRIKPNDLVGERLVRMPPTEEDRRLLQYIQSRVDLMTLTGAEGAKWRERLEERATSGEGGGDTHKDSGHYSYSPEKREAIVKEYRQKCGAGEVLNKHSWAKNTYGICGKTLRKYELEFPEGVET